MVPCVPALWQGEPRVFWNQLPHCLGSDPVSWSYVLPAPSDPNRLSLHQHRSKGPELFHRDSISQTAAEERSAGWSKPRSPAHFQDISDEVIFSPEIPPPHGVCLLMAKHGSLCSAPPHNTHLWIIPPPTAIERDNVPLV
ncbi:hypothetical protein KIL84_002314 [Mauremys mutica]|uniref:Uncharacterized protein n=1 Tax=Mauremys mutica TaxID=74926 RepID=A0A9D3X7Y8_9SAUR|nr:hypothetical protein KIL84_002314 [Mauremys mutica]